MQVSLPGVDDIALETYDRGDGRPIVVLHGTEKLETEAPLLALLARHGRVVAPAHPGFGNSPLPDWIDSIDDLAYLYLDLLDKLALRDVVLVGLSMGGWIAAEMAVKCSHNLSHLVLVSPLGIKISDRETRDVPGRLCPPAR